MYSITMTLCYCFVCDWLGTVGECEPDVDGDGSLGCQVCREVVEQDLPDGIGGDCVQDTLR